MTPAPTTTTSASAGSSAVVRWPSSRRLGSACQYDLVGSGTGRVAWLGWVVICVMAFFPVAVLVVLFVAVGLFCFVWLFLFLLLLLLGM